jgi:hypothetical protein
MKNGKQTIFINLGASNHTSNQRDSADFYATDPIAAELLLRLEDFEGSPI